ncbi:MAG: hypothetical protein CL696_13390 [Chloroflexi bacterium]|nr:hypothetical protein [Chloroflexota bacterium]MQG55823.1 hypothetical protein [SAR202 cluster bacterium]
MGAEVSRGGLVDGRIFWVRPVGSWVLESGNVVAQELAVSLDKPLEWAVRVKQWHRSIDNYLMIKCQCSRVPPS